MKNYDEGIKIEFTKNNKIKYIKKQFFNEFMAISLLVWQKNTYFDNRKKGKGGNWKIIGEGTIMHNIYPWIYHCTSLHALRGTQRWTWPPSPRRSRMSSPEAPGVQTREPSGWSTTWYEKDCNSKQVAHVCTIVHRGVKTRTQVGERYNRYWS